MSYRKSLIKKWFPGRFGLRSVTEANFVEHTARFVQIFEGVCGPSTVRIELYAKVPYFTTFMPNREELEAQKRFNEEGMRVLTELAELPEDFSDIPYVRVLLHPQDESRAPRSAFGVVDFGRRLSSHIIFYAQPEEVAEAMEAQLFPRDRAPRGFALGDGFEENAGRYVPGSALANSPLPEMLMKINLGNRVPNELRAARNT